MVVLGINSRATCFSHFHSRHCEINFFERRRRARRVNAESGHRRRVTRLRLRTRQVADCFFNELVLNAFPTRRIRKFASHARCEPTASSAWWFDAAISRYKKKRAFWNLERFFHMQPKYQNDAIFVNIEGLRPCLIKPSCGATQWGLIIRLLQKERLKSPQKSLF